MASECVCANAFVRERIRGTGGEGELMNSETVSLQLNYVRVCLCVCVRACVRASVCACVCDRERERDRETRDSPWRVNVCESE